MASPNAEERATHAEGRNERERGGKGDSEQLLTLETGRLVGFYTNIWGCSSSFDNGAEQAKRHFRQTKKPSDQPTVSTSISEK